MTTNKERIEALEAGLGGVQSGMQRLEETIIKLVKTLLSTKEDFSINNNGRKNFQATSRGERRGQTKLFIQDNEVRIFKIFWR